MTPNMDRFSEHRDTFLDSPDFEREADIAAERADYLRDLDIERRAEEAKLTAKEHSAFPKGRWT